MKGRASNEFLARINANGGEIKAQRAEMLMRDAKNAYAKIVIDLQDRLNKVDIAIDKLCDIGPTDSTSLLATKEDFNADKWATNLQALQVNRDQIAYELEVAETTYDRFFGEPKVVISAKRKPAAKKGEEGGK